MNQLLLVFLLITSLQISAQRNINADVLLEDAFELFAQEEHSLALSKIKEAIHIDTNYAPSWLVLADFFYQTEKYAEAIRISEQILEMPAVHDSIRQETFDMIGFSYIKQENLAAALLNYNRAIQEFDSVAYLYYSRGLTHWNLLENKKAIEDFKQAILLEKNLIEAHQAILELANEQGKSALVFLSSSFILANFYFNQYYDIQYDLLESVQQNFISNNKKGEIQLVFPPLDMDSIDSFKSINFALAQGLFNAKKSKTKKDNSATQYLKVLNNVCLFLEEKQKENKGTLWGTYGQYFIDLKQSEHLETASYLINFQNKDKKVLKWIRKNLNNVKSFENWTFEYQWRAFHD